MDKSSSDDLRSVRTPVRYDDLCKLPSSQDRRKVVAKRRSTNQNSQNNSSLNESQTRASADVPNYQDNSTSNATSDRKNDLVCDNSTTASCIDAQPNLNSSQTAKSDSPQTAPTLSSTGTTLSDAIESVNKTEETEAAPHIAAASSPEVKNQNRKANPRNRRSRADGASDDSESELLAGHQALPIDAEVFAAVRAAGVDWSTPAADADEYLARVVCEAASLPRVCALRPDDAVVKKRSSRNHYWHRSVVHSFREVISKPNDAAPSAASSTATATGANRVPPLEWQLACVASFERTRREFASLRSQYLDLHADDDDDDATAADCDMDASADNEKEKEKTAITIKTPALTDLNGWLCFCFGCHNATQYRARLRAEYRAACAAARPPPPASDGPSNSHGGVKREHSSGDAGAHDSSSSDSDSDSDAADFDYRPAVRIDLNTSATACEQLAALKQKQTEKGSAPAPSGCDEPELTSGEREQTQHTPQATKSKSKSTAPPPPKNEGRRPLVSLISRLENEEAVRLLELHARWLGETHTLSSRQAEWLFALLASLDAPFTREATAAVRDVVRACRAMRESAQSRSRQLQQVEADVEADEAALVPDVDTLNVLICIGSRYFRQYDLADESTL